ncbi:MAG: hypothetical protein Q8J74_13375 [Candidatus Didemnitutus sp.]|nr:hypothetical protein [Candidatus Didemnitutus sp.]
MKGRQPGRPTKWVSATVNEPVSIGKPGVKFEVWDKWKQQDKKHGTLTVSVGGVKWRSGNGKTTKSKSWDAVEEWFNPS